MNRHEATRRVVTAIAIGRAKVQLPYVADDGSQPLIVTTPGEYLSEVMKRVEAVGGGANIALAEVNSFFVFEIAAARGSEPAIENDPADHLNADMSMGMFKIKYTGRKDALFSVKGVGVEVRSGASSFAYA